MRTRTCALAHTCIRARTPVPHSRLDAAVVLSTKDDTIVHTEGQLERHKHKAGTIVQLERVGYAIVIDNVTLLLCHEESQEQ